MTEDEAKTRWCPQRGRIGSPAQRALSPGTCCIGPACMAWRWIDKAGTDDAGKPNYYPGHWQGYCGLGGRP